MRYQYNGYKPSFKERMYRFFSGRNGSDTICYGLLILYLLNTVINFFVSSVILWLLGLAIIAYMWFRIFSRNIYKRRIENEKFKSLLNRFTRFFRVKKRAFKERDVFVYRKCPGCKSMLRLPKRKGRHNVKCPRCHKEFSLKI